MAVVPVTSVTPIQRLRELEKHRTEFGLEGIKTEYLTLSANLMGKLLELEDLVRDWANYDNDDTVKYDLEIEKREMKICLALNQLEADE